MECLSWRYDQSGVVATLHLGEVTLKKNAFILACYLTGSVVEAIAKKNSQKIQPGRCIGIPGGTLDFK